MTIPSWSTAFTDGISTISAAFLNYVRANLVKAIDGVGGSNSLPSAPSTKIQIYGEGLEIGGTTPRLQYESHDVTRAQRADILDASGVSYLLVYTIPVSATGRQILDLPHGNVLKTVIFNFDRGAYSGVEPAGRATVTVNKYEIATKTLTAVAGPTTIGGALGVYESYHEVSVTGLSVTIDNVAYIYYAIINGEQVPNAQTVKMYPCKTVVTMTAEDEC